MAGKRSNEMPLGFLPEPPAKRSKLSSLGFSLWKDWQQVPASHPSFPGGTLTLQPPPPKQAGPGGLGEEGQGFGQCAVGNGQGLENGQLLTEPNPFKQAQLYPRKGSLLPRAFPGPGSQGGGVIPQCLGVDVPR